MKDKRYSYYLFDWDGTLANTLEVWFNTYQKLFSDYGIKTTYNDISKKAYGDAYGCQKFGINDYKEFNKQLFTLVEKRYYKASLYSKVKETLKMLCEDNFKIAIVSSTPKKLIYKALDYHKLNPFIDFVVGREDVKEVKPNPQAIEFASSKNYCNKNNMLLIGDSDKDIHAGENYGIDTVLFIPSENYKYYGEEKYKDLMPTYKIKKISEVIKLVN